MFSGSSKLLTATTFLVLAIGFLLRQMVNVEILQPRLSNAERSTCLSNLKQIGMAVQMYAQDNADKLPRVATPTGQENWMRVLNPYLHDQKLFSCPANKSGGFSYVWNDAYTSPKDGLTSPSGQSLSHIANFQTVLVADGIGNFRLQWEENQGIPVRFTDSNFRLGSITGRHNGLPNVLFCDGHVAAYGIEQVFQPKAIKDRSYFAGLSIEDD